MEKGWVAEKDFFKEGAYIQIVDHLRLFSKSVAYSVGFKFLFN